MSPQALLWFHGITLATRMRDIGWVWLALVVGVVWTVMATVALVKLWRQG